MSKKQERFVVRTCGCHRGMDHFINFLADSRVDAVRYLEQMGKLDQKEKVGKFLEGEGGKNEFDRYDYLLVVDSTITDPEMRWCKSTGSATRHSGVVMLVFDR